MYLNMFSILKNIQMSSFGGVFNFTPEPVTEYQGQNSPSPLNLGINVYGISKFIDIKSREDNKNDDSEDISKLTKQVLKDSLDKFSEDFSSMGAEIMKTILQNSDDLEQTLTKVISGYSRKYAQNIAETVKTFKNMN
jgi:uncharacterized protein YicC (UPF0701 family)